MDHSPLEHSFRLFTDVLSDMLPATDPSARATLTIVEHEDRYLIECDLPGVPLSDIHLEVHDGVLEISGQRSKPDLADGCSVTFNERTWTPFRRCIRLHKSVDLTAITADYTDGVLAVTAPRVPETRPQNITIRAATGAAAD